jgi:hypothetical protein
MADIATVFHWTLSDMDKMYLPELIHWRELAKERSGAEE